MSHAPRRRLVSVVVGSRALALAVAGLTVGTTAAPSNAQSDPTGADCLRAVGNGPVAQARQRTFAAAASTYDVPTSVLLGVSYLESRWDDHGASPSTSGGYGPMHLTDVAVPDNSLAKGDGTVRRSDGPAALHTASTAAALTKLSVRRLTSDDVANICGGAALLASYQRDLGKATGTTTTAASWYGAVKTYSGAATAADETTFAQRVYSTLKSGEQRTTIDGQRLQLAAQPQIATEQNSGARAAADGAKQLDCPATVDCEWIPAPYEWYGEPDPFAYGNHDYANREQDIDIDYIVIHDTEGSYPTAIKLVTDPTYVSWNYTMDSSNGHIAQHLDAKDIGFHAGTWYMNMHSIGIEHTGFAATGASWYTEAMYQNSAALVKYLADKYSVKLDRAHIIGHDQVPGILPDYVRGMHWDPGPYWNWEHYMRLMGAPIVRTHGHNRATTKRPGKHPEVMTVAPGFADNVQPVTGCTEAGRPCEPQGTNFVYLHTQPDASSPLVTDVGLHPDGSPSTTVVSDHGARLAAGQKVVVADRVKTKAGSWLGVWYLGDIGWMFSPKKDPDAFRSGGPTVSAKPGAESVPVYGRAYPEEAAYAGTAVPYQTVAPLQYTIKAGQAYSLADATIATEYYYAKTYDSSLPDDHTVVTGQDKYYEIWFGHRMFYVRAADVVVSP